MEQDEKKLLEELRKSLENSPFVMLGLRSQPALCEPMTACFDNQSYPRTLYFYTRTDNRLVRSMGQKGPDAIATYASKNHSVFSTLSGRLTPCNDASLIDRFWSNGVAAWFEGKDDPMLQMLSMDISHVEIWEADVSVAGKLKLVFGGDVQRDDFQGKHANTPL